LIENNITWSTRTNRQHGGRADG